MLQNNINPLLLVVSGQYKAIKTNIPFAINSFLLSADNTDHSGELSNTYPDQTLKINSVLKHHPRETN